MEYLTYDKLKFKLNRDEYWKEVGNRRRCEIKLPFKGKEGKNLRYINIPTITESLSEIMALYNRIEMDNKDRYEIENESFSTCTIEGARTTIADTINISAGIKEPSNKSEVMVGNTLKAIKHYNIEGFKSTEEDIINIWKIISEGVLENEGIKGDKYRNGDVIVGDGCGRVVFRAPEAKYVQDMMNEFIELCNDKETNPILKAILIHYIFVYIHPFCDGNGGVARFLLNSSLIESGLDKFKEISITSEVHKNLIGYYKALENSENILNDITFFIIYYLEVIRDVLLRHIRGYDYNERNIPLNNRQKRILVELRKNRKYITAVKYSKMFNISKEDSEYELNQLNLVEILDKRIEDEVEVYYLAYRG